MLNNVRDAVIACLAAAELHAGAAYPRTPVPVSSSMIRVGITHAEDRSPGFAGYLGVETDSETGSREIYGMQCSLGLSLDIYVPLSAADAAGDCLALFDRAVECIGTGNTGLKIKALHCGEPAPDKGSGMMHLRGEADAVALLVFGSSGGEEGNFSEFVLRGELRV